MDTIKNLNILDEHLESLNVQIQNELAKGTSGNSEKLLDLVCAVSTCSHSNFAATERMRQKKRAEFIEKSQSQLIELSQNNITSGLNTTAGTLQLLCPLITIGALLTGAPAGSVDALLGMFQTSAKGIEELAKASSGMDKTRPMALEFAIEKEKNERNEDQSSQQASKTHESEGLRLLKEILNSRANKEQSVAKGG